MLEAIITFLVQSLISLVYGVVLLIVALVILPEHIVRRILRRLKPDLVSRSSLMGRVRLILDYVFNLKDVVIIDTSKDEDKKVQEKIRNLMKEKKLLEGNLFFLDLLKNLSNMLYFSVIHSGYGEAGAASILAQSMEYLQYYAQQLKDTPGSRTQRARISSEAERFQTQLEDTIGFLQEDRGEEAMKIAVISLKQGVKQFDSFMKSEYNSTKEQLTKTNQLLAESLVDYVDDK